ncbi:hypothetical protein V8G54_005248 [Vigna mungo]|uniref:Uncharacterized protein n=1 Tax=Vigna mungo TaxID=3915 RepID=A0AAQ3SH80_VIGMU
MMRLLTSIMHYPEAIQLSFSYVHMNMFDRMVDTQKLDFVLSRQKPQPKKERRSKDSCPTQFFFHSFINFHVSTTAIQGYLTMHQPLHIPFFCEQSFTGEKQN